MISSAKKKYIIKAKDHNSYYFSRSGSEPVMWIRIDCLRSLESIYFFRFRLEKYNFLRKKLRNLVVKICFSPFLRIHGPKLIRNRPNPDPHDWSELYVLYRLNDRYFCSIQVQMLKNFNLECTQFNITQNTKSDMDPCFQKTSIGFSALITLATIAFLHPLCMSKLVKYLTINASVAGDMKYCHYYASFDETILITSFWLSLLYLNMKKQ